MRLDELKDWLHDGRWVVPFAIGIGVLAIAVVLAIAWPTIKPRPKGQLQPLSTVVTSSTANSQAVQPPSAAVKEEIMKDLGVEDAAAVGVSWANEEQNQITVRVMKDATDWENYTYVQVDGEWKRK